MVKFIYRTVKSLIHIDHRVNMDIKKFSIFVKTPDKDT